MVTRKAVLFPADPKEGSQRRVPLDKREGSVKGELLLGGVFAPLRSPERLRTKTLEISR
jgi:hypothetical protein